MQRTITRKAMNSKNLSGKAIALTLMSTLLADPSAMALVQTPDEINVQKYKTIYESAKQNSENKRAEAEQMKADAEAADERLSQSQANLDALNQTKTDNLNQIAILETQTLTNANTIRNLEGENITLSTEHTKSSRDLVNLENLIVNESERLRVLRVELRNKRKRLKVRKEKLLILQGNIVAKDQELADITGKRDGIKAAIRKRAKRISEIESETSSLHTELAGLGAAIQANSQAVVDLQVELRRNEKLVADLKKRKTRLSGQLSSLQGQYDSKVSSAKPLEKRKSALTKRASSLNGNITAKDAEIRSLKTQISTLEAKIQALPGEISSAKNKINTLNSQITSRKSARDAAKAEVDTMEKGIAAREEKIAALRAEMLEIRKLPKGSGKKAKIQAIMQRIRPLAQGLPRMKQLLEGKKKSVQSFNTQIANLVTEKNETEKLITDGQGVLDELKVKLADLKRQLSTKKTELASLNSKRDGVLDELSLLSDEIDAIYAAASGIKAELDKAKGSLASVKQKLSTAETALGNSQKSLSKAEAETLRLSGRDKEIAQLLPKLDTEKSNLRNKNSTARNRLSGLKTQITTIAKELSDMQAREQAVSARIANREQTLATERNHLRDLKDYIDGLSVDYGNLETYVQNLALRYSQNQDSIATLRNQNTLNGSTITNLRNDITRLDTEMTLTESEINRASLESQRSWDAYSTSDREAANLEQDTSNKYTKFAEVENRYNGFMNDAVNSGYTQSEFAEQLGEKAGEVQGASDGAKSGHQSGIQEGLLSGYIDGLKFGLSEGKSEGYDHGLNTPANYEKGRSMGFKQGQTDAHTEAMSSTYPESRAATKADLLSNLPTKQIIIDMSKKTGTFVAMNTLSSMDTLEIANQSASEKSALVDGIQGLQEMVHSLGGTDPVSQVEGKIRNLESKLSALRQSFSDILSSTAPVMSPKVDRSQANCHAKGLAGYSHFVNACLESFEKGYVSFYNTGFSKAYKGSFNGEFGKSRTAAFGTNKSYRYAEGKNESKPVAYAQWDAIGAEQARSKGYTDGKKEGFASELPHARAQAKIQGEREEKEYFLTHGVLRIQGASAKFLPADEKDGVVPGARLHFNMKVANFGDVPTKDSQVRLSLKNSTGNVTLTNQHLNLPSIPGKTVALVEGISGIVIGKDVKPGEKIKIELSGVMPDGFQEKEQITLQGEFHVKMSQDLVFSDTPKRKSGLGRKTHEVVVNLTNISKSSTPENFTVVLDAPGFSKSNNKKNYIEIKEGMKVLNSLERGKSASVTLKYKIRDKRKAMLGKKVTLRVRVIYGARDLVSEKSIEVVPR